MSENLKLCLFVLIKNTVVTALFVTLAMFLGKWWIAPISLLYTSSIEEKKDKNNDRR